MKRILAVGLVASASWCGPALADWQDTRWGMSLDDVEQRVTSAYRPKNPEESHDPSRRHVLSGTYTTGNYSFISKFYFDRNNALVEVKLELINRDMCKDLRESLVDAYGLFAVPNIKEFGDGKWKDWAAGNMVSYNRSIGLFCNVTYAPIPQPGQMGGL